MANFPNLFLRNDFCLKGTITYCIAFITMIIIPIYHWYIIPLMILWGVIWLFEIRFRIKDLQYISLHSKILFILFISFYIWQIIGMVYSDNPEAGWRNIVLRISLFLFPLVLISPGELIRQKVNTLLRLFTLSTFFFLIFCLGYALYRSFIFKNGVWSYNPHPPVENWLNYFYGSEFAIFHHPSYLSMYALFSVFIAAESFFDKSVKQMNRMCWLLVSIYLLISIYLLSSRAEILATIIAIPVYFFYKYRITSVKKIVSLFVLIVLICLFILVPIFKSNPRLSYYFNEESKEEWSSKLLKESRLVIWKSSFTIARHHIVFGVGTGDIQDELNKEYKLTGDKDLPIENNLNSHNQFLEVLLENGLIGLLLFLSLFGMIMYISIKEGNLIYLMFIFIVFVSFLFETMLNRLAGVSFFALFSFLLPHTNMITQTLDKSTRLPF